MIDFLRTRQQFCTKRESTMDTITQLKSGIHLEENSIVTCCAKRSIALNHYVCVLKCLLYLMLNVLRHMIRNCECKNRDAGGVHKCLDNRCLNNKVREQRKNKSYAEKEASSRNKNEKHPKACSAKEALKNYSNLEPGSSTFLIDSDTFDSLSLTNNATDSDSLVLPANSNAGHKDLKTRESLVQHSLDQSSTSSSEEHTAEIKSASKVDRTELGNTWNNPSTKIHDQERDSKHSSSIASTSTCKNQVGGKHGVHQTKGNEVSKLDLDSGSIDIASLETDDTFRWQETDDSIASLRSNQKLENKLKEILHSANLLKKYGTFETASFSEFADTLSNDSDKPIRNDSLKLEKDASVQNILQINTALADRILEKDADELLNRDLLPKEDQLSRNIANHCCSNLPRGIFDDHLDGKKKQYLESGIASSFFSDTYHMNYNVGTNNCYADKTALTTPTFVCLENTKLMCDAIQLNDEQNFFPMTMHEHHDELDIVSLKGVVIGASQNEGMGDQQKTWDGDPDPETGDAGEGENAGGEEGETGGERETEGEDQEAEEENGGEKGGGGSEQGGKSGEEGAEDGGGNNYLMIMMRVALGPSADEAVLDAMDVIKRVGEFVKGSVLKEEGGGGSSEGGTEGGEKGGESEEEKGGTEEGGAEADEEGNEKGSEVGEEGEAGGEEGEAGGEEDGEAGGEERGEESEVGADDEPEDAQSQAVKSEPEETKQNEDEEEDDDESEVGNEDLQ